MRPVLWEWQKERLEEDLVPDPKGLQGPWAEWGMGRGDGLCSQGQRE